MDVCNQQEQQQHHEQHEFSIEMNNLGVSSFQAGDYEAAIEHLTAAFKATKAMLDGDGHQQPQTTPSKEESSLNLCTVSSPPLHTLLGSHDVFDTDEQLIFRGAIQVNSSSQMPIACNYQTKVMISVVVVFNLALAHHLLSLTVQCRPATSPMWTTPPSSSTLLNKAAKLYQLAYNLQQGQGLISMASVNNLGQIHRYRGDREGTERCTEHLLSTLLRRMHTNRGEPMSDIERFFQNIVHVMHQERHAAAAAA